MVISLNEVSEEPLVSRAPSNRKAQEFAGHDPVLPFVTRFSRQKIGGARLDQQVEAIESSRGALTETQGRH